MRQTWLVLGVLLAACGGEGSEAPADIASAGSATAADAGGSTGSGGASGASDEPAVGAAVDPAEDAAPADVLPGKGPSADSRLPPSLTASALRDELRQRIRPAELEKLEEERAAVAAEKAQLEKLASRLQTTRDALREETDRLQMLVASAAAGSPGSAQESAARPARRATDASEPDSARLESLANAVRGMKPEQAAAMMTRLPRPLAASLLVRLRPRDAGLVLDKLPAEVAAELIGKAAALPAEDEG